MQKPVPPLLLAFDLSLPPPAPPARRLPRSGFAVLTLSRSCSSLATRLSETPSQSSSPVLATSAKWCSCAAVPPPTAGGSMRYLHIHSLVDCAYEMRSSAAPSALASPPCATHTMSSLKLSLGGAGA
eukprot:scaffold77691_cov30-Tisochrysis_lutea.AAC.10